MKTIVTSLAVLLALTPAKGAEIARPADAPPALSPAESVMQVKLPPGFRLELVASEPLIQEPSCVCWDERGRMFVSELHGYNLEGQYDIEALNRTGKLDHEVRRIQADEKAKEAAKAGTSGTVKMLVDTNGDGRMDKAETWAAGLPPCYGLCAARGGVIVACAPDIYYLADRDGDGKPEVRERLFTGFAVGALERGVNYAQWGPDDWIYFGIGHGGGLITGPRLAKPVDLPRTDLRIRADGTAIEPITGSTKTIGMAFTADGERFVVSTRSPAIHVGPIAWRYFARNPFMAAPGLENDALADPRAYPISKPHPWRQKRSDDPEFAKYYTDRYGEAESTPNGYFTSGCSPIVYQDEALPGLRGRLLACEPAQNFVSRMNIERDGSVLRLRRLRGEEHSEFLASADAWFHPINLLHGPDGALWIVDFYREIIEDYSAIPRYLQQQYGLVQGRDKGRVWRLVHEQMPSAPAANMNELNGAALAAEIGSDYYWRRQTARRLLVERGEKNVGPQINKLASGSQDRAITIFALATLEALKQLRPADVVRALGNSDAGVRVHALRLAEPFLDGNDEVWRAVQQCRAEEPQVRLQLALSVGESKRPEALVAMSRLAGDYGDERWMGAAIQSGLRGRSGEMLLALIASPNGIGKAAGLVDPLCAAIGAERSANELSDVIGAIATLPDARLQAQCLGGLRTGFRSPEAVNISVASRTALKRLAAADDAGVKVNALGLMVAMKLETALERQLRLDRAIATLQDTTADPEAQVSAVTELTAEHDAAVVRALVDSIGSSTPRVRDTIVSTLVTHSASMPLVLDAIEEKRLSASALTALERRSLLDAGDREVRSRAAKLFEASSGPGAELLAQFTTALANKRDIAAGGVVFKERCSTCHQAHGVGLAVGPDLTAEFGRAEETMIGDILAPSANLTAGYWTYIVVTVEGRIFTGILAAESATSVTLLEAGGREQVILRKDIDELKAAPLSLMPDDFAKILTPTDAANVIAWIRQPSTRRTLVDDNINMATLLDEGSGVAEFESADVHSGRLSLRVTPPQRFSPRISGWEFRIREKPGPGEYRYLRFAWKTDGGDGVMLEFADDGRWPPAERPIRRYYAGKNNTGWKATEVAAHAPAAWTEQIRDLWADFGEFTLTGIAPTAIGGPVLFDRIELLQEAR